MASRHLTRRGAALCAALVLGSVLPAQHASAAELFIRNATGSFLDFVGANPGIRPQGLRLVLDAFVVGEDPANPGFPDPDRNPPPGSNSGNTTVTATSQVTGAVYDLPFFPSPSFPDEFATSIVNLDPAAPLPDYVTGAWLYQATNDFGTVDTRQRLDPGIGNVTPLPLVTNAQLDGAGNLSWVIPAGAGHTSVSIDIITGPQGLPPDPVRFPGFPNGVPPGRLIGTVRGLDATTQTFNILDPAAFRENTQLAEGDNLVARIRLDQNGPRADQDGNPLGSLLNRSSTFLSFSVLPAGTPPVFVPTVDGDGVFNFDITVAAGQPVRLDPFVAVGYDFAIGLGDPVLFESVRVVSDVGDGVYDLFLFDLGLNDFIDSGIDLLAGELFTFSAPVERFSLRGIEAGAGLDPTDPTAFITEVTFAGSGQFTGTMTAIQAEVPVPATVLLLAGGLLLVRARRRA